MKNLTIEIRKRDVLAAVLILLLLGMWLYDRRNLKNELTQVITNSAAKDTIMQRFRDDLGREHIKGQVREYTIAELKASNNAEIVALRAEVGAVKNLVSHMKIQTTTAGNITAVNKDTVWSVDGKEVTAKAFNYTDRWLKLTGLVNGDSTYVKYSLDNTQGITWQYERESKWKFWRSKDLVFKVTSDNPYTTVNKVQTIKVSPDRGKFWQKQWFAGLVGVAAGVVIQAQVLH